MPRPRCLLGAHRPVWPAEATASPACPERPVPLSSRRASCLRPGQRVACPSPRPCPEAGTVQGTESPRAPPGLQPTPQRRPRQAAASPPGLPGSALRGGGAGRLRPVRRPRFSRTEALAPGGLRKPRFAESWKSKHPSSTDSGEHHSRTRTTRFLKPGGRSEPSRQPEGRRRSGSGTSSRTRRPSVGGGGRRVRTSQRKTPLTQSCHPVKPSKNEGEGKSPETPPSGATARVTGGSSGGRRMSEGKLDPQSE